MLIIYFHVILKSLRDEVEIKSENVILFSFNSDLDLDNDDELSLCNANKIYRSVKTDKSGAKYRNVK